MNDNFPILALVATRPSHPYQLLEDLRQMGLRITRSTLYRHVDALVADGSLETLSEPGDRGNLRRMLHLTPRGVEMLARVAVDVLRDEPMESPAFTLALTCADPIGASDTPATLRLRMLGATRQLTVEEHILADQQEDSWKRAARERRIAHLRADIDWLETVLARGAVAGEQAAGVRAVG